MPLSQIPTITFVHSLPLQRGVEACVCVRSNCGLRLNCQSTPSLARPDQDNTLWQLELYRKTTAVPFGGVLAERKSYRQYRRDGSRLRDAPSERHSTARPLRSDDGGNAPETPDPAPVRFLPPSPAPTSNDRCFTKHLPHNGQDKHD